MNLLQHHNIIASGKTAIYGDINLIFDGNSLIAADQDNGINQYIALEIEKLLRPQCRSLTIESFGIGGQAMATMLANYDTKIDPVFQEGKLNVLFFTEDANGIGNGGDSGQGNVDKTNAYSLKAKENVNRRWNVVLNMVRWRRRTPYPAHIGAPELQRFEDWRTLVLNDNLTNIDGILYGTEFPDIGGPAGQAQDGDFVDNIHLTEGGNDKVVIEIFNFLTQQLLPFRL